jgi:hypothetical protein
VGDMIHAYKNMVGKLEGKGPLGRPRRRREYNIKLDVKEKGKRFWTAFDSG